MEKMSVRIERKYPRPGGTELPIKTEQGYQLADPKLGSEKHHAKNVRHEQSLEKAVLLIENGGFSIRKGRPGLRPSLISRNGLKIIRS
jgi:hypothetical protein